MSECSVSEFCRVELYCPCAGEHDHIVFDLDVSTKIPSSAYSFRSFHEAMQHIHLALEGRKLCRVCSCSEKLRVSVRRKRDSDIYNASSRVNGMFVVSTCGGEAAPQVSDAIMAADLRTLRRMLRENEKEDSGEVTQDYPDLKSVAVGLNEVRDMAIKVLADVASIREEMATLRKEQEMPSVYEQAAIYAAIVEQDAFARTRSAIQTEKEKMPMTTETKSTLQKAKDTIVSDATDVAWRTAAIRAAKLARAAALKIAKSGSAPSARNKKKLANLDAGKGNVRSGAIQLLESEYGESIAGLLLGIGLSRYEDPRLQRLSKELRVGGGTLALNAAIDELVGTFESFMGEQLLPMVAKLPLPSEDEKLPTDTVPAEAAAARVR